jgi:hypothetical protein
MDKTKFIICIDNTDYPASLERRKIYELVPDPEAEALGQIRVIDESGEDYLYPARFFVDVELSEDVVAAIVRAA